MKRLHVLVPSIISSFVLDSVLKSRLISFTAIQAMPKRKVLCYSTNRQRVIQPLCNHVIIILFYMVVIIVHNMQRILCGIPIHIPHPITHITQTKQQNTSDEGSASTAEEVNMHVLF